MKKLIVGMMAAAIAFGAFCENTAAQPADNNPLVVSDNFFGSIRVDTKSEFTMVAAPFEGFASQFDEGAAVPNAILARDVVAVEKLNPTDTMSIFNPTATDDKEEFDNYIARKASVKIGKVTYEYMEWLASMWFDEETMTSNKYPDPDVRIVPTGSGVFIGRDTNTLTTAGFSIYAYGQIPTNFPSTIELTQGKTPLSAPADLAYQPINVNEDITFVNGDVAEVTGGKTATVGQKRAFRPNSGATANADRIRFYKCSGAKAQEVTLYRYNGVWYAFTGTSTLGYAEDAVIPAGHAFWFLRNGEDTISLQW